MNKPIKSIIKINNNENINEQINTQRNKQLNIKDTNQNKPPKNEQNH